MDAERCYPDADGDGVGVDDQATSADVVYLCDCVGSWATRAGDCDDTDPTIFPGAREACSGFDEDCDGLIDEHGADGELAVFPDSDGDGYGTDAGGLHSCEIPEGYADDHGDCDDSDPTVSPGAVEVWYDGLDQDCAGDDDHDADGDGARALASGGTDCDDTDPAVQEAEGGWWDLDGDGYGDPAAWDDSCTPAVTLADNEDDCDDADATVSPDAEEICDDGIDNNCDRSGVPCGLWGDWSAGDASFELRGTYSGALAGVTLLAADVVGGDGQADLLVGAPASGVLTGNAPGEVSVVRGPIDRDSDLDTWAQLSTTGTQLEVGADLDAGGDVDGDGFIDLLVGAAQDQDLSETGSAWLVYGPLSGNMDLSMDAAVSFRGSDLRAGMGEAVVLLADQDGDGGAEVVLTEPLEQDCVQVHLGLGSGEGRTVTMYCGERVGRVGDVAVSGDLNADGLDDLILTSSYWRTAFGFLGPITSDRAYHDPDVQLEAGSISYKGGVIDLGDLDGDGHLDAVVGTPAQDTNVSDGGSIFGLRGPLSATMVLSDDAVFEVYGTWSDGGLGDDAAIGSDLDGDGLPEVWASWPGWNGSTHGALFAILGTTTGTLSAEDAYLTVSGASAGDMVGRDIVVGVELTGDGHQDVAVGAHGVDQGSGGADGAVFLFEGGGLW